MIYAMLLSLMLWTWQDVDVGQVESAVEKMVSQGIPKHEIKPRPRHPILRDGSAMREFSLAVLDAAEAHEVPPFLLVAIALRESSILTGQVGTIGETTMFQMTKGFIKAAKRLDSTCDPNTVRGSARCAAVMLYRYKNECGTWGEAIAKYATGKRCYPTNKRVAWIMRDRVGIALWLQKQSSD